MIKINKTIIVISIFLTSLVLSSCQEEQGRILNYKKGVYVCAACKTPLYKSEHKYDSRSGWPSFDRAIKKNVELDVDYKIGYARTELKCNTCGGHLGHSFNDGPRETTGERHCINGAALEFIPSK